MNEVLMVSKMHETPDERGTAVSASEHTTDADGTEMVLWTRRPVCGPRTEVIDRLSKLQSEEAIASFTVETWPTEVAISEHTEHGRVVEMYKEFLLFAEENGLSITPPFERRTVSSLVGESEDVLTLPIMCLAVYDDGLSGVYPCTDGDQTWSVADYLDAFEGTGDEAGQEVGPLSE